VQPVESKVVASVTDSVTSQVKTEVQTQKVVNVDPVTKTGVLVSQKDNVTAPL